jgi:hypothetical protein
MFLEFNAHKNDSALSTIKAHYILFSTCNVLLNGIGFILVDVIDCIHSSFVKKGRDYLSGTATAMFPLSSPQDDK